MSNATAVAPERATKAQQRAKEAPAPTPAPAEQQVSSGLSPSLIVLSLRPEGSKFNGDRIERAQEAGFGWLKKVHLIGMSDLDTGGEIARHVVHGGHEAFGVLKEIQIHIDPETCAWMWRAGEVLMDRLKRYAVLIGASVCDGLGQPLTDEAMLAIRDHIDAVIERRRDEDRLARIVTLPNGERRELSELSFAYEVLQEAGSKKKTYRSVRFDVPSLHYYEGRELGMRMTQLAGERVFVGDDGEGFTTTEEPLRRWWKPAMKLSGLRQRDARQTRHTFATVCLMAGITPAWAARQLGHSVEMFYRVYSRWIDKADKGAERRKLDGYISAKPGDMDGKIG